MTNIQIQKRNGITTGFVISGHSGYSEEGTDIVCSAVSSLSQMVCVGLENVLNLKPIININQKKAELSCKIKDFKVAETESVKVLFDSFEKSVQLLLVGDKKLKKYINLEVKNEIY